jgi:hypothetical protein
VVVQEGAICRPSILDDAETLTNYRRDSAKANAMVRITLTALPRQWLLPDVTNTVQPY